MKEIKNIYLASIEEGKLFGGHYGTGLILETVDGRWFRHQSTDPVMPFEEFTIPSSVTYKK